MKCLIFAAIAAVGICLSADAAKKVKLSPEEIAARREKALRVQGGFVIKPGMQKGRITIINAQDDVGKDKLQAVADLLAKSFKIAVDMKTVEIKGPDSIKAALEKDGANAAIVVGKSDWAPSLLAAPGEKWAFVNISKLKGGDVDGRTQKEIVRGFAYVCGAASSQNQGTLLDADMDDLDKIDLVPMSAIPGDVTLRMSAYMKQMGITPWRRFTYKRACLEGWAPAPTNDVQKAIWDKVHAMPTAPLKIKPETKKVVQ